MKAMNEENHIVMSLRRVAMACFVEGIDPFNLSLAPRHLIQVEEMLSTLKGEIPTVAYHQCLESLSSHEEEAV